MATVVNHVSLDIRTGLDPSPKVTGLRLKYPGEGGNVNPDRMPAVCPALQWTALGWQKYIAPVTMTEEIQLFIRDFMLYMNPLMSDDDVVVVLDANTAFTNVNGWGYTPNKLQKRQNYIYNIDMTEKAAKLDDAIICAGSLYQGVVEGNVLACYPGVHAIDGTQAMPDISTVVKNGWYFAATSWHEGGPNNPDGFGEYFPQGHDGIVAMPRILTSKATYPLEYFEWWERDAAPNVLAVGG